MRLRTKGVSYKVNKEFRAHSLMVFGRVVLGDIVCNIAVPWSPVNQELFLGDPVPEPMETHVNGLGVPLLHCAVKKTNSCFIVNF